MSLLRSMAKEVPRSEDRFTLVAVDGVDGSGKSSFAQALAVLLGDQTVLIKADNFHNLRSARYRLGRDSPQGFWLDSYDYEALLRCAIQPFGPEGDGRFKTRATDLERDVYVEQPFQEASTGTVVIVEGMFLHRDELRGYWDYSIFLDVPFKETAARMARRDGSPADPAHPKMRRYVEGQRIYFHTCAPWLHATRVVDNTDWNRPRLIGPEGLRLR